MPCRRSAGTRRAATRSSWSLTGPAAVAVEVEVGVAGQADDRGRVGGGLEHEPHGVVVHHEAREHGQVAGEALVAVGTDQPQGRRSSRPCSSTSQTCLSKPAGPPCSWLSPSFGDELHRLPVELEPGAADPVGVAADGAADVVLRGEVLLRRRVAQHHVAAYAVPAGQPEPVHRRAEVEHLEHRTRRGPEHELLHGSPRGGTEGLDRHGPRLELLVRAPGRRSGAARRRTTARPGAARRRR